MTEPSSSPQPSGPQSPGPQSPGPQSPGPQSPGPPYVLHVSKRDMLRPLRDQILRVSGFQVDSTLSTIEAMDLLRGRPYDLVLVDVEGEHGIPEAESLCSQIKTANQEQLVAFVCNWRVAVLTDCPDEIVRTEFDPAAFVAGVRDTLTKHSIDG